MEKGLDNTLVVLKVQYLYNQGTAWTKTISRAGATATGAAKRMLTR